MKTLNYLKKLIPLFVKIAQKKYDEWQQNKEGFDELLGYGGICQEIASGIAEICNQFGIEATTVSQEMEEQHVYALAKVKEGVYSIDISPYIYEIGGGYSWRKRPGVIFFPEDIEFYCVSSDPYDFELLS